MGTYDIWPSPTLPDEGLALGSQKTIVSRTETIEELLQNQFYSGWGAVVLFPSCRAAIYSICELLGLGRDSRVGISAWSSHCVIEAVGRLAMPLADAFYETDCVLVNHQWGHTKLLGEAFAGHIIEDSCDSLMINKEALFSNHGRFEIFSLPKILGTAFGGLVFCKNVSDAETLKNIRCTRSLDIALMQYRLKCRYLECHDEMQYGYYCGMEAVNGLMPLPALRQIDNVFSRLEEFIQQRRQRAELLERNNSSRCPVAVPIRYCPEMAEAFQAHGFNLPVRHFDFVGTVAHPHHERCICVPIHQGVSQEDFETITDIVQRVAGRGTALAGASGY